MDQNYLASAVNELFTYTTPKEISEYIEREKIKAVIGNSPY